MHSVSASLRSDLRYCTSIPIDRTPGSHSARIGVNTDPIRQDRQESDMSGAVYAQIMYGVKHSILCTLYCVCLWLDMLMIACQECGV